MPIAICRACKSYAGKAINYVTDEKKAERITINGLDESRSLSQQFIDTAHLHGKGETYDERKYYHIKFSFEPKDRIKNGGKLDAELAEKITNEYLQNHYKGNEYVLATHIDKEHIHCHAIINAVSFEDGKKIQHSNYDLMEMKDQINDISEQYGVSRFDWKQAVKERRLEQKQERIKEPKLLTQAEKYIKERLGDEWTANSWKDTLRCKIDEAKGVCTSRAELQDYLKNNYNIEMPRNTDKTVSFIHPAVNIKVRGAKLGADYTNKALEQAFEQNIERNISYAKLRYTDEKAGTTGHSTGPNYASNIGDSISKNDPIGSGIDESGECATQADIGRLHKKLSEIRGIDKQFNPDEQRRVDEDNKRDEQQAGKQSKGVTEQQPNIKPKLPVRDKGIDWTHSR